jgi:hypothetical protein
MGENVYIVQVCLILLTRKMVILDIRPNRNANDHSLISTINIDERSARTFSLIAKKHEALSL